MEAIKDLRESQSFKKGWMQVSLGDAQSVREEIMQALGVVSEPAWYRRLNGLVSPKVSEVLKIEEVFKKYGITKIWGE